MSCSCKYILSVSGTQKPLRSRCRFFSRNRREAASTRLQLQPHDSISSPSQRWPLRRECTPKRASWASPGPSATRRRTPRSSRSRVSATARRPSGTLARSACMIGGRGVAGRSAAWLAKEPGRMGWAGRWVSAIGDVSQQDEWKWTKGSIVPRHTATLQLCLVDARQKESRRTLGRTSQPASALQSSIHPAWLAEHSAGVRNVVWMRQYTDMPFRPLNIAHRLRLQGAKAHQRQQGSRYLGPCHPRTWSVLLPVLL